MRSQSCLGRIFIPCCQFVAHVLPLMRQPGVGMRIQILETGRLEFESHFCH